MFSTWKIAPALAAGCTVLHKPAELSPLSATILADIAQAAGVPAGVWNIINGLGEVTGQRLTQNHLVRALAFVGGSEVGSQVMAQAAPTLKRLHRFAENGQVDAYLNKVWSPFLE